MPDQYLYRNGQASGYSGSRAPVANGDPGVNPPSAHFCLSKDLPSDSSRSS
jgi:hypothetical protein